MHASKINFENCMKSLEYFLNIKLFVFKIFENIFMNI